MPVELAVGDKAVAGKTSTSHWVAVPISVQLTVAPERVIFVAAVRDIGARQVGAGPQETFADHPVLLSVESLINLKVSEPSLLVEVKGPGIAVPQ